MNDSGKYCVVMSTVENRDQAEKLAGKVLNRSLAACVQLSGITSYYWWEKRLEQGEEVLMRFKTREELYPELQEFLEKEHPYEVPQVIKIPVTGGLPAYLDWIDENIR